MNEAQVKAAIDALRKALAIQLRTGHITLTLNDGDLVSVEEKTHRRFVKRGQALVKESA